MKIHKILGGLLAVVMSVSMVANETQKPVSLWSRAKNAVANNKLVTGLVTGSAVLGGSALAYMKSAKVKTVVSAGVKLGKDYVVAPVAQYVVNPAVAFGKAQYAAMPGYIAPVTKSMTSFAVAHPSLVLGAKVTAVAGLTALVGYGLYKAYRNYRLMDLNIMDEASGFTSGEIRQTNKQEYDYFTDNNVLYLQDGTKIMHDEVVGKFISLNSPERRAASGCAFYSKSGKAVYLTLTTIEDILAKNATFFEALKKAVVKEDKANFVTRFSKQS